MVSQRRDTGSRWRDGAVLTGTAVLLAALVYECSTNPDPRLVADIGPSSHVVFTIFGRPESPLVLSPSAVAGFVRILRSPLTRHRIRQVRRSRLAGSTRAGKGILYTETPSAPRCSMAESFDGARAAIMASARFARPSGPCSPPRRGESVSCVFLKDMVAESLWTTIRDRRTQRASKPSGDSSLGSEKRDKCAAVTMEDQARKKGRRRSRPFFLPFFLPTLWAGRKPTLRTVEMLRFYFAGWASEDELADHIAKLKKEERGRTGRWLTVRPHRGIIASTLSPRTRDTDLRSLEGRNHICRTGPRPCGCGISSLNPRSANNAAEAVQIQGGASSRAPR